VEDRNERIAQAVPSDRIIWTVVQKTSEAGAPYYPHEKPCLVDAEARLTCPTLTIGEEQETGKGFTITVILADEETRRMFADYFVRAPSLNYPGLRALPDSAEDDVLVEIPVVRR
jgi:hypothetical protein